MSWHRAHIPQPSETVSTFVPTDGSDPVLFDSATSRLHRLQGTASSVWAAIDGTRSVDEIVALLGDLYGGDVDDIDDALAHFSQRGLLRD